MQPRHLTAHSAEVVAAEPLRHEPCHTSGPYEHALLFARVDNRVLEAPRELANPVNFTAEPRHAMVIEGLCRPMHAACAMKLKYLDKLLLLAISSYKAQQYLSLLNSQPLSHALSSR